MQTGLPFLAWEPDYTHSVDYQNTLRANYVSFHSETDNSIFLFLIFLLLFIHLEGKKVYICIAIKRLITESSGVTSFRQQRICSVHKVYFFL